MMRRVIGPTVEEPESPGRPTDVNNQPATPGPLLITGVEAGATADVQDLVSGVVAAVIALWRLQARVERERREGAFDPPKWLVRQLESARDTVAELGIESRDHTGEPYIAGLALTVMAFQPKAGTTMDVIAETVKPSVFIKGALVQPGQVIVAIPEGVPSPGHAGSDVVLVEATHEPGNVHN